MKNLIVLIACLLFSLTYSQEKFPKAPCVTDALLKELIEASPDIKNQLELLDKNIYEEGMKFSRNSLSIPPSGSITIPIVVYVVHDGTPLTNISDAQVNDQLNALNNYYLNTGIKFCLATKANAVSPIPTVNASDIQTTTGIIHVNNSTLSNHSTNSQSNLVATASPQITKDRYLRIWIVKSIDSSNSGILGYSMYPNTSPIFDGIVMRYDVFGNGNPNLLANYNMGKVLVHEVGHYLALHHTFDGGCSNTFNNCSLDGDRVCDTPAVAAPNFNCIAGTNSCPEIPAVPDDLSNYMDYGNHACQNHFSTGQIQRMLSTLYLYRSTLFETDNIIYTGTCGSNNLLSATISTNDFSPCASSNVATSFSAPFAQTYSWNFGDAFASVSNPNTANTQSASHIYTSSANSPYTVTLTVTNSNGESKTSSVLIYVTNCTPIANGNSYWYVDASSGLNFSSGKPIFDPTFPNANFANLSCNAQCDSSGNLLFYTNKFKVWNNLHSTINSTDLMLNSSGNKSEQVLIVPKPPASGNAITQYYIFIQQSHNSGAADVGFRYNIVNVSGTNATMGAIRQPITLPASYGFNVATDGALLGMSCVSAVKKCNGNDYWIITLLKKGNTPYLVVFSLSNAGLVYQSEQMIVGTTPFLSDSIIQISPNGNKIFLMHYYGSASVPCRLFDFNKAQGIVSSSYTSISIPETPFPTYSQMFGSTFSPDSNLLYVADQYAKKIYQFNINTIGINNSRKEIASTTMSPWSLKNGPDGKIYVTMTNTTNDYEKLSVIHSPNIISTNENPNACNFSLNGPKPTSFSYRLGPALPNHIDAQQATAYFDPNTTNVISKYITACNTYKFFPNVCGTTFVWTFTNTSTGTSSTSTNTNPTYNFSQNGSYIITLKDNSNVTLGTSSLQITTAPIPSISGSGTACLTQPTANVTSNSVVLQTGETGVWSITGGTGNITGPANLSSVNASWSVLPGTLTFTMTNAFGCTSTNTQTISSFCPNLSNQEFSYSDFQIKSNPSHGVFIISSGTYSGKATIEVFDMQGRMVSKEANFDFNKQKTLDLTALQSGVFLIKIFGYDFISSMKIIKD
ncbi:M43 family zinc metalloprotease [Flavobacterium sp.]|uniref:M43 family zinc metalloprotease n=1 Tax=Flavobacterium sp. TaxID=239 RepID=UPI003D6BE07E